MSVWMGDVCESVIYTHACPSLAGVLQNEYFVATSQRLLEASEQNGIQDMSRTEGLSYSFHSATSAIVKDISRQCE